MRPLFLRHTDNDWANRVIDFVLCAAIVVLCTVVPACEDDDSRAPVVVAGK